MNIHTTSGHLTATNKVHIRTMIDQQIFHGKINRTSYQIEHPEDGTWTVYVTQTNTETIGDIPRQRTDRHTFQLK